MSDRIVVAGAPDGADHPLWHVVDPDGTPSDVGARLLATPGGPYVGVLPAGADPQLLDRLVRVLQREPSVAAVGLGTEHLRDVLVVPAGPVALRRSALAAVGGPSPVFDDRPALARADLGWRLRNAGWRVCTAGAPPDPAAEPESAGPDARTATLRLALWERNLGDAAATALLPAALAATRRGHDGASAGAAFEAARAGCGRVDARSVATRADREVLPYVRAVPWLLPPGIDAVAGPEAARLLAGRQRVVLVTLDLVGPRMAGPAIRAWELAHALAAEHDVTLVAGWDGTVTSDRVRLVDLANPNIRVEIGRADVVVVQGWALHDHPWIADLEAVLVVDLYDPIHLETLEVERGRPLTDRRVSSAAARDVVMAQVRRGDFFLCASRRQRDLWLGHLAAAGRLNPDTYDGDESLEGLLAEVPFGVSAVPPPAGPGAIKGVLPGVGPDDDVLLWGGGIYNWFDPLTLIRAVAEVSATRPSVRLVFLGSRHPNPAVPEMAMTAAAVDLADELGLTGKIVFFNEGWVPYDERGAWFGDADLGVSCHFEHLETAYAFRTRMLDYLWAGLPIVATEGDVFADLVVAHDVGAVVPAQDVTALAAAIEGLLDDPDRMAACRRNTAGLAAELGWDVVVEPLRAFCRRPRRAPDLLLPEHSAPVAAPPRPGAATARRAAVRLVRSLRR